MPALRILSPGTWTLLVDHGRPATRSLGVPLGGAADRRSLGLGNALLGNPPDTPALEIALSGPTLLADAPLALVLMGAPFDLSAPGLSLRAGKTFTLPANVPLAIHGAPEGMRAYLCAAGGFVGPRILGSSSTLAPLRAGDALQVQPATTTPRFADLPLRIPLPQEEVLLRVIPGSHADRFEESAFGTARFTVGPQSNRMGLRLRGEPLSVPPLELTSEPVCPGTVQVPRDGLPIVLGMDCQTIGGYPRLAQVIRADLDRIGQLRPGMRVGFQVVTVLQAEEIEQAQRSELQKWQRSLLAAAQGEVFGA